MTARADVPMVPRSLGDLLDALEHAAEGETVSIRDMLREIGRRSFTPVLLAVAIIVISPISAIPTVPTIAGTLIVLIAGQGLLARDHLWLPKFLLNREIGAERFCKGINWLRGPCNWVDRHSHSRLSFLTEGPARRLAFLLCIAIAITWPVLELLPMVTSIGAAAIALIAFGLLTDDGLYTLLGYTLTATVVSLVIVVF